MFKAKLIENQSYYRLRSKQQILALFVPIPVTFIVCSHLTPLWIPVLIAGLYITLLAVMATNQKKIASLLSNKVVEMDADEIRIKSSQGIPQEAIHLDDVHRIVLSDTYLMPQETIKEMGRELVGKAKQNHVILYLNNRKRRLDFEIDSYYMKDQLSKVLDMWKKAYSIEIDRPKS